METDSDVNMDYLHYRYKNWQPFDYIKLSAAKKRVARVYMKQEIQERNEFLKLLGGE